MRRLSIRKLLAVALFLAVVLCLSTYLILRRRHMSITYEGWASRLDSHPRIYFAKDGLEDIRRKCSEGVFKDLLDELRAYADAAAGYLSTNGWANSRKLQMYAFLYAVTGDEKYAQYAEVYIKWFTSRVDSLDSFELGMGIEAVAEGLDWCYGYLKPEKLSEYGKGLTAMCDRMIYKEWRHSDFNNHVYIKNLRVLYAAIALKDEDEFSAKAEEYLNYSLTLLKEHLIPATNLVAAGCGGWHEGVSYEKMTMPYLAMAIEAWRVFSGEDLFPEAEGLKLIPIWNIYCLRPDLRYVRIHDSSMSRPDALVRAYMLLLAARYRDGYAQWLAYQYNYSRDYLRDPNSVFKIFDILWWDPSIKPQPPNSLPTDRFFRGLGWLVARSSWSSDAVYTVFECGPYYGGHQHMDQGNFIIFGDGGYLAVDSGYYDGWGSSHHMNYFRRTIAHNTLIIYDPEEEFTVGDLRLPNDGGQLIYAGDPIRYVSEKPPEPGRIADYRLEGWYVYALGNLTNAYNRSKVSDVERFFVYVKPNLFIVYDIVEVNPERSSLITVKWLLHTINEPQLMPHGFRTGHNSSVLTVYTLKPADPRIVKVGGPGHEFEVQGVNYPPSRMDWEAGAWRVEIENPSKETRREFLNVLTVTRMGENPPRPELLDTGDYLCVTVTLDDRVIMVFLNPRPGKPVSVDLSLERGLKVSKGEASVEEENGVYRLKATFENCLVLELERG
ncbi:heparinase II/III family protein [Candidatus Bathyarchaeota archaeon]|nr:heparinase II/III family protein [Candidatus Bathyarchaeota archaeon]